MLASRVTLPAAPSTGTHERYRALDGYRFVAAALVLLHHYNMDFKLGGERLVPILDGLYVMVDFFFVLSGFVIAYVYFDRISTWPAYFTFLRRRLARVYPLHALVLAGYLALAALAATAGITANNPDFLLLSNLPANLTLTQAWGFLSTPSFNVPSWSISAEWFLYLLFPLFAFAARRLHPTVALVLILVFILAMDQVRQHTGFGPWTQATYDFGMLRAVPTFFAGILIAVRLPRSARNWSIPWPVVHALFIAGLATLWLPATRPLAIVLFTLTVAAAVLAERRPRASLMGSSVMARLGDASYGLYMLHVFCSIPVLFFLRRADALGTPRAALAALITAFAVLLIALWLHRFFEVPARILLASGRRASARVSDQP